MKDFMLKHPFITLVMFEDVCILIVNVVQTLTTGQERRKYKVEGDVEEAINFAGEKFAERKERKAKKEKVEMGFR